MARPTPVGVANLSGGQPTGNLMFFAIPEESYKAISDAASSRGMTVAHAIVKAINDFCAEKPR